jgi:DNA-binding response OmpR family regulator
VCVLTDARTGAQSKRHVLFVNADADLRSVVTRVLERERFRVCAVPHSGHALLLCRTERFDLAIVELSGPDISGPSLLQQLRRHQP